MQVVQPLQFLVVYGNIGGRNDAGWRGAKESRKTTLAVRVPNETRKAGGDPMKSREGGFTLDVRWDGAVDAAILKDDVLKSPRPVLRGLSAKLVPIDYSPPGHHHLLRLEIMEEDMQSMQALHVINEVLLTLKKRGVQGEIRFNSWDAFWFVGLLWDRYSRLYARVDKAAVDLKKTRAVVGDRRFGQIRKDLEEALRKADAYAVGHDN